ncbi:hypothetical protein ROLI_024850 [Roseobacter fucihabitans]|uniref:VPLPA-CTERM protein sorting domain-containing protein n=1 Tax=Roseobacter fucihabitans TaxID=1537242 RepID=A0ABZ2BVN1_9RHOB|nr:VPLPA-CTERM sorting domain-containing protein [Roseobacter litoralis]MBC6965211.1 hypothetical protein [Roseobacter litoralis]
MKTLFLSTISAMMIAGGVSAASITFTENQGTQANGLDVPAGRSVVTNLTDGDVDTFYSLGIGGSLTASIAPQLIAGASLIEVTFNNTPSFPESAQVYLGIDTSGILLGELFNFASGVSSTSANGASIITAPNTPSTGRTSFVIDLGVNSGSALTFVDTTSGTGNKDGFDIAELSIAAVPLPAAGLLLLAGIGGLAAVGRRKKS